MAVILLLIALTVAGSSLGLAITMGIHSEHAKLSGQSRLRLVCVGLAMLFGLFALWVTYSIGAATKL